MKPEYNLDDGADSALYNLLNDGADEFLDCEDEDQRTWAEAFSSAWSLGSRSQRRSSRMA